ncbi:MAG: class I SAM-dependent methyltransferase [Chloroflexi bacterium]|nr:class I SAM-dependent methyltransferase [Chloroflexota bacterium]MYC48440.1 class I SAM-dependent methyltransferase [Chloroflexota bacterium]
MKQEPSGYGDRWAEVYDQVHAHLDTPEAIDPAVSVLSELAGDGPALELGIGTGRIALPLARRGVCVEGMDASAAMVEKMRQKPGGADIPVHLGDFAKFDLGSSYSVVFVVFNTFFALTSQDEQASCMRSVSRHLSDEGVLVIEAFVPDMGRFERGQHISASNITQESVSINLDRHNPVTQTVVSSHLRLSPTGVEIFPVAVRYAWPSELDLMARLAGLRLRSRWADWHRSPFTATSPGHVSVYQRA